MEASLSRTPPKIPETRISTSPPSLVSDPRVQYENLKKKYLLSLGVTKPVTLARNPRGNGQQDSDISLLAQSLPSIPTQLKLHTEAAPRGLYGFDDNLASSPLSSALPTAEDSLSFKDAETLPRKARASTISAISIPVHSSNVPSVGHRVVVEREQDEQEDPEESEISNSSEPEDSDDIVNTLEWDDLPSKLPKQKSTVEKKKVRDEKFIPPHELLKKTSDSFSVGTARDVALWEQRRRNMMDTT